MIPSAEGYYDYVDSDEALMALAARTENASRAESMKRQAYLAMEDESKIVKIGTGRKKPSRVSNVKVWWAKFFLFFDVISLSGYERWDIIMCGLNYFVIDTHIWTWVWVLFLVLANVTAGLVLSFI